MKPITKTLTLERGVSQLQSKMTRKVRNFSSSCLSLGTTLVFMVLFSLNAKAQVAIPGTTLSTNASSPTATSSCVTGQFASGWNVSGKYWEYSTNATNYHDIKFTTKISSSSTGPMNGTIWYTTDNWAHQFQLGSTYTWSTSCGTIASVSLPTGTNYAIGQVDFAPNLKMRIIPAVVSNAGGTNRVNTAAILGTAATCTSVTGGTTLAGSTSFCADLSTTLSLSGATSGGGITYQWQYRTAGSMGAFSPALGTNNGLTYSVTGAAYGAGSYEFQCLITCPPTSTSATSSSVTITINALPSTPTITGGTVSANPMIVDNWNTGSSDDSFAFAPNTGVTWSSSNPDFVIDPVTGDGNVFAGGISTIKATATSFAGCQAFASVTVNAVWDNTLALYAGFGGTSTDVVVGKPHASSTSLTAGTSFGSTTPCGSGGLSGKTVPNTVSAPDINYAMYYTVSPVGSFDLNAHEIHAKVRVSATGPTKAKIGYKIGAGAWTYGPEVTLTDGSCGTSANDWYLPLTANGITSNITIGVFPYTSTGGSFQVNQLELLGDVTPTGNCSGTPSAGTIRVHNTTICNTGSRILELVHPGGGNISYQWEKFNTGTSTWDPISGEIYTFYNTGTITAPAAPQYRVVVTCSGGSTATTATTTINADVLPTATITSAPAGDVIIPNGFNFVGNHPVGTTEQWFSNYVSNAPIVEATGVMAATTWPATITVTYKVTSANGCFGTDNVTFNAIHNNPISYYLGATGTSTSVVDVQNVTSTSVNNTGNGGFGSGTTCTKGGLSGMTNAPLSPAPFSLSGPYVSYTITNNDDFMAVSDIRATVRSSGSGPANFRFAYRVDGGTWVEQGGDQSVDVDDCGYSAHESSWSDATVNATPFSLPFLANGQVLEVALFPFNAGSNTGAFQVNSITVFGRVAPDCGGSTQIQDGSNVNVDGGSLCIGTNPLHLQVAADETYWMAIDPNDPAVHYFDNASIAGSAIGTLEAVSTYTDAVIFALGYKNVPGCLQLNSAIVDYTACSPKTTGINNTEKVERVSFFPNPATDVVNVKANEAVNVTINSIDGKKLVQQKDVKNINISNLANGVYFIHAYDSKNVLIKTEKLIKN